MRQLIVAAALVLAISAGSSGLQTSHAVVPYAPGDVFAGVGGGQINHYNSTGTLLEVLNTTSGSAEQTGMCFDAASNLYSTNWTAGNMSKFDNLGGLLVHPWGGPFSTHPETCVVDAAGDIYVGEVDGANLIRKFDAAGNPLATFSPAVEARGIDWMDLASDQCTMSYTSEGSSVKRFDVCTNTQLPDFATGLSGPCFALRIRANAEVMVTCSSQTYRLNPDGSVNMTYPIAGESLFAMNLDPDGLHFWTGGYSTGNIYKVNIATGAGTGAPVFTAPPVSFSMAGLAIFGEPTQGGGGCAESPIAPSSVEATLFPGQSLEVEKCVETPEIPPKPDLFFVFDTTGSMGGDIATVQAKLAEIIATVGAQATDPEYGVAKYEDFPFDPWGLSSNVAYDLLQTITSDTTAVTTAINSLSTFPGSGGDTPESGYEALYQALTGAGRDLPNPDGTPPDGDYTDAGEIAPGQDAGFRPDASKVILLVGDAAFHFPGDPPTSLQFAAGYPGAGQADVLAAQGDVSIFCLIPAELEGVGPEAQCDALGATSFDIGASSADIVDAIVAALGEVEVEVSMQSDCTAPITTTFDPASQTVVSGSTVTFTETISVAGDAPGGTYECDDHVLIDGELLLDPATGEPAAEHKVIKVPEGFLTGGGQIDTGKGPNALGISFGGNVGFLADFSLVGQWQTNFHNVSVDGLDKARFHSTAITALQFFQDGGPGPYPPPANANVGSFTATGRLNGEDGWTLDVCLADRGEPGRQNDSIRVALTNPGGVLVYDSRGSTDFASEDPGGQGGVCDSRHKLDSGNFQIHSGVKGP